MTTIPEWTSGTDYAAGTIVRHGDPFALYVAEVDIGVVFNLAEPGSQSGLTIWRRLDRYRGTWVQGAYAAGEIVLHTDEPLEPLFWLATDDIGPGVGAPDAEGGTPWLLFGGRRAGSVPDAERVPTLWRVPFTGLGSNHAAFDSGLDLDDVPDGDLLFRFDPPDDAPDSFAKESGIHAKATIEGLGNVEVGDNLVNVPDENHLAVIPHGGDLGAVGYIGRTVAGDVLLSVPRSRQSAVVTILHQNAWPLALLAAVAGDIEIDVSTGTPTARIADAQRLPTPSPELAGLPLRVNPEGTGYVAAATAADAGSILYASPGDYRARADVTDRSIDDELLTEQLTAASRIVDMELRVSPGYFAPYSGTHHFSSKGGQTLMLRDDDGLAYALRTVEAGGIRPDYALTGRYDQEEWDLDDAWIWPLARNAPANGRPYYALQLRRVGNVPITIWPWQDGSVQITGDWGWASTPAPIRELVVKMARDMRDSHLGGAAARIEAFGEGVAYRDETWRLWRQVKIRYGRRQLLVH